MVFLTKTYGIASTVAVRWYTCKWESKRKIHKQMTIDLLFHTRAMSQSAEIHAYCLLGIS